MYRCGAGIGEGGNEGTGYEPEMGAREEREDKGAVVEEAEEEGVCALKRSTSVSFNSHSIFRTHRMIRSLTLVGYTQTPKVASLSSTTAVTSWVPVELVLFSAFAHSKQVNKHNKLFKSLRECAIALPSSKKEDTAL